jgi:hypothetical protein
MVFYRKLYKLLLPSLFGLMGCIYVYIYRYGIM